MLPSHVTFYSTSEYTSTANLMFSVQWHVYLYNFLDSFWNLIVIICSLTMVSVSKDRFLMSEMDTLINA